MTEKWAVLISAAGFFIAAIIFFLQGRVLGAAIDVIGGVLMVTIAATQMKRKKEERQDED